MVKYMTHTSIPVPSLFSFATCVLLCYVIGIFHCKYADAAAASHRRHSYEDLPLIPSDLRALVESQRANKLNATTNKYIPSKVWIAVRNISDVKPGHYLGPKGFLERNKDWEINFCGNAEKDLFMRTYFMDTSVLWAYNILNPQIGTAKAEIWRIAVLYVYGGMYMDDDANIATPLSEVVRSSDKFIIGKEAYDFDDRCFKDSYSISNYAMNQRFGESQNAEVLFGGKWFFNWAMFSMPGHPILLRTLQHIVAIIQSEYQGDSAVKMGNSDHRGKLLQCSSTFPITLTARELVLEIKKQRATGSAPLVNSTAQISGLDQDHLDVQGNKLYDMLRGSDMTGSGSVQDPQSLLGLRIGGVMFEEYGADIKAWNNDWMPTRWVKMMKRVPYLSSYAPPDPRRYENRLIQGARQREVYHVSGGERHTINNMDVFTRMNFSLENVQIVSHAILVAIPVGDPLL